MRYTVTEFRKDFPDDDACLQYVFEKKYPDTSSGYFRIKNRKAYADKDGNQIHPLKGTIFEKTTTPLLSWFFAIYLFSQSKHGVSAKELSRLLGVTYKTAWRMCHLIRRMMEADAGAVPFGLGSPVEMDETYVGGKGRFVRGRGSQTKVPVFGMVQRKGRVHATVVPNVARKTLFPILTEKVPRGATVMTDEFVVYRPLGDMGYDHRTVEHGTHEYVRGENHTNTMEGYWSQLKATLKGTYRGVSRHHLQSYVSAQSFLWNHRDPRVAFRVLMERI